jgi:3-oxoacyl-[acyl-carrier protein] reductase
MESRVALITGGARGIGRAVARDLSDNGWAVAVSYRTSAADAAALVTELKSAGRNALAMAADVSDPAAADALVDRVDTEFGRVDALINCVGPYRRVHLLEETTEGWRAMFDNNLHPIFYLARKVAPKMIERQWGRMVNFSMANADQHVGQPYITAHYIAKAGVLMLTRSLAKALAPHGITVNAVSPGIIETGSVPIEEFATMVRNIPAGFVGAPQDAAAVVKFLLSDAARYVNGTNIHVSGAWGL